MNLISPPAAAASQRDRLVKILGVGPNRFWRGAVLAGVLSLIWGSLGLTLVPEVNHDEVMLNAPARNWQLHGVAALPLLESVHPSYASCYYWHPPGHLLVTRFAYGVFGFSIQTTRGVSLVFSALFSSALFLLGCRLTGRLAAGVGAVAIFSVHDLAWWLPRSGRMDEAALLFGTLALLYWLYAPKPSESWKAPLLAGALIGIGSMFHVVAAFFAPALFAAEAARRRRIPWRMGCLLAISASIPLLVWVGCAFARSEGNAWREQFIVYQLNQRHASLPLWQRPWSELLLLVSHFKWTLWMLPTLAVLAYDGWRQLDENNRRWLIGGLSCSFFLVAMIMAKGTGAYPLYWYFWLSLVGAAGVSRILDERTNWKRWACGLGLASVFVWQGVRIGIACHQREARSQEHIQQFFAAHVSPGSLVLGPEDIWYGVDAAGAMLQIWAAPNPARYDYYVTYAGKAAGPAGFRLEATLPDTMPKIFGRYFSHTACAYDLWISETKHPLTAPVAKPL